MLEKLKKFLKNTIEEEGGKEEKKIKRDYSLLRERIKLYYKHEYKFAKELGLTKSGLSRKLNGSRPFKLEEIEKIIYLLEIPEKHITIYFFGKGGEEMKEKELKREVEDFLKFLKKTKPIKFTKIWGGGYYQKPGIPDYICCINGIYLELELKGEGGKVSETQKENLIMSNKVNGLGILLYPAGFDDFKKIIEKICEINGHINPLEVIRNIQTDPGCQILLD